MNRATLKEIEQLKRRMPSKNQFQISYFSIKKSETGFEVKEIVSNDFAHLREAVNGDSQYIVADNTIEFDTVEAAAAWLNKHMDSHQKPSPCLAVLGSFTKEEMDVIRDIGNQ